MGSGVGKGRAVQDKNIGKILCEDDTQSRDMTGMREESAKMWGNSIPGAETSKLQRSWKWSDKHPNTCEIFRVVTLQVHLLVLKMPNRSARSSWCWGHRVPKTCIASTFCCSLEQNMSFMFVMRNKWKKCKVWVLPQVWASCLSQALWFVHLKRNYKSSICRWHLAVRYCSLSPHFCPWEGSMLAVCI